MRAGYWLFMLVCGVLASREVMAFWWLFSGATNEPADGYAAEGKAVERQPASFEMASAEQKFLSEAQQYLDLPPLEKCQYRVVAELRRSCGELNEEDLGKLSVALLNCQSQAENRQTFQCTRDMALAECTAGMDAHVWNTYHIISNRARSVCYATRQQQFRKQTEAVVNQLSLSTLDQLKAMGELSSQQSEVKQLASSSLETLHDFQQQSVARDRELEERQEGMREKISHNLEQLAHEKVLINSGQQLLANMTEDIKRQLEVASDMLGSQENNMRESQKEIIDDITTVQENIQQVWGRIDNSTTQLLSVLEEISSHYQSTLESLQVINESLVGMQAMVEGMRSAVTSQLDWVVGQLGGANQGLRVLSVCASHTLFLLVSTLCVVFVRAPGAARAFLLLSVVGNAVLDLKTGTSLTFTALAVLETAAVVLNWVWLSKKERRYNPTIPPYLLPPHSLPPSHHFDDSLDRGPSLVAEENEEEEEEEEESLLIKPCQPTPPVALRNLTPHFKVAETLSSTPTKSHPHPSHPPLSSHRCSAFTHSGIRCRLRAVAGSSQCHRHDNQ